MSECGVLAGNPLLGSRCRKAWLGSGREGAAGRAPRSGPVSPACPRGAGARRGRLRRRPGLAPAEGAPAASSEQGGPGGPAAPSDQGVMGPLPLLGAEPLCELLAGLVCSASPGASGSGRGDPSGAAGDWGQGSTGGDPQAPSPGAGSPLSGGGDGAGGNPGVPQQGEHLVQGSGRAREGPSRLLQPSRHFGPSGLALLALFPPAEETAQGGLSPPHLCLSSAPASPSPGAAESHRGFPLLPASSARLCPRRARDARPRCPGGCAPSSAAGDRAARPAVAPDGHWQ